MAELPQEVILLRDLPNDAMYVSREWWEFMVGESHKLRALKASLRALMREHDGSVPDEEIWKVM